MDDDVAKRLASWAPTLDAGERRFASRLAEDGRLPADLAELRHMMVVTDEDERGTVKFRRGSLRYTDGI